jgi:hypothetical protein
VADGYAARRTSLEATLSTARRAARRQDEAQRISTAELVNPEGRLQPNRRCALLFGLALSLGALGAGSGLAGNCGLDGEISGAIG